MLESIAKQPCLLDHESWVRKRSTIRTTRENNNCRGTNAMLMGQSFSGINGVLTCRRMSRPQPKKRLALHHSAAVVEAGKVTGFSSQQKRSSLPVHQAFPSWFSTSKPIHAKSRRNLLRRYLASGDEVSAASDEKDRNGAQPSRDETPLPSSSSSSRSSRQTMEEYQNNDAYEASMRSFEPGKGISQSIRTVDLGSLMVKDDGPPRLCSVLSEDIMMHKRMRGALKRDALPLMIYLPGIDGTGLAAARQFPSLLRNFDLVTLITPSADRTKFETLTDMVVEFLEQELEFIPPDRPVYLLGESFGAILAISVGLKCPGLVDRLVLGPLLSQVPQDLYRALPFALAPILGNPINLLAASLDGTEPGAPIEERLNALALGAAKLLRQLPLLAELLPPETLAWKLQLLEEGCKSIAPKIGEVSQRVLIVVGEADALIPSLEEGRRLQRLLPRSHLRIEAGRSHALLQESGVDLVKILQEEGALVTRRRLSAPSKQRNVSRSGAGFGTPAPLELPTEKELERVANRTTAVVHRLSSPVFFSTSEEGMITQGIAYVPTPDTLGWDEKGKQRRRPVLFVGNHQSLALDLGVLFEEFLREKNVLLRGLAHPVIFSEAVATTTTAGSSSGDEGRDVTGRFNGRGDRKKRQSDGNFPVNEEGLRDWLNKDNRISPFDIIPEFGRLLRSNGDMLNFQRDQVENDGNNRATFANFMTEFGAVPVSAKNMMQLLKNGESILLFPGGVREAYRRKNEEYKLFWPKRAEFVRMAAKYNAVIVPFGATGIDDSLNIVLDNKELQEAPFIGKALTQRSSKLPQARRGVSANEDDGDLEESFVAPLAAPKFPPRRMYFVFRKPIFLDQSLVNDKKECARVYELVKAEVEAGLRFSLKGRELDPYADFGRRFVWETLNRGKQAPTFSADFEGHEELQ